MLLRPELEHHNVGWIFVYMQEVADSLSLVDRQPQLFRQRARTPVVLLLKIYFTDGCRTLRVIARYEADRRSVGRSGNSDTNRWAFSFNVRCQGHQPWEYLLHGSVTFDGLFDSIQVSFGNRYLFTDVGFHS